MPRAMSYLICATPRSGTTMLCDLLTATGRAGAPHSYYRRQDISKRAQDWGLADLDPRAFDRAYLEAVLRAGTAETGVFGLRLMWGTLAELSESLGRLYAEPPHAAALLEAAFGPLVYVHVSRQDKVAQAVSLLRAEQSGLWHIAPDGAERQRSAPQAPIHYDAVRLSEIVDELERDDAAWTGFFAAHHIAPVQVTYEELIQRPGLEVRKILSALGDTLELTEDVTPGTAKMADRTSQEWAERFRRERGQGAP